MRTLIRHELRALLRSRRLHAASALVALLLAVAGLASHRAARDTAVAREAAVAHARAQWEGLGAYNPHGAAHFGSYAFKPVATFAMLDGGVDAFVGNVLRLEGHVQHPPTQSAVAQDGLLLRFGRLDPALVLHTLVPLVLIFVGFGTVAAEREAGRLGVLLLHGGRARTIVWSKALALWVVGLLFLLGTGGLLALLSIGSDATAQPDWGVRAGLAVSSYALWYLLIALVVTLVSAIAREARTALSALLLAWVGSTVLAPRVLARIAEQQHPLPARAAFEQAMRDDRALGIDGHSPEDARQRALKDRILAEYGVTEVAALPINFDGILMQEDEEYGNAVWDKHFGALEARVADQQRLHRRFALLDPWLAVRALSSASAGTDVAHALDFQHQAEAYRRDLIKALNREHAMGGSRTDDWEWKASATFFQGLPDFAYRRPRLTNVAEDTHVSFVTLLGWSVVLLGLTSLLAPRLLRPTR
jgi:ABC-2 type transport system permease protein